MNARIAKAIVSASRALGEIMGQSRAFCHPTDFESWMLYHRHIKKLYQMTRHSTNTEILQSCHVNDTEAFLLTAQLRWSCRVMWMENSRVLKMIFYSQLQQGQRSRREHRKRYKDALRTNLGSAGINSDEHELLASDRTSSR